MFEILHNQHDCYMNYTLIPAFLIFYFAISNV